MARCMTAILVGLLAVPSAVRAATAQNSDGSIADELTAELLRQFNEWSIDPQDYRDRVRRACRDLPDGEISAFVLPALAYANLALRDPSRCGDLARRRMPAFIDSAIATAVRHVRPPGGKLANLRTYRYHAACLARVNLAIGAWRLIGGDDRYEAVHHTLSACLHAGLVASNGQSLKSTPSRTRTLDTTFALLSLHLRDLHVREPRSRRVINAYLDRLGARQPLTRGSDLALQAALLKHLSPKLAGETYRHFADRYWREKVLVAGFREWPDAAGNPPADLRSGPIIYGVGRHASFLGIAACAAAGDGRRHGRLVGTLPLDETFLRTLLRQAPQRRSDYTMNGRIQHDGEYVTGMLLTDAMVFYAITWTSWATPAGPPTQLAAEDAGVTGPPMPPSPVRPTLPAVAKARPEPLQQTATSPRHTPRKKFDARPAIAALSAPREPGASQLARTVRTPATKSPAVFPSRLTAGMHAGSSTVRFDPWPRRSSTPSERPAATVARSSAARPEVVHAPPLPARPMAERSTDLVLPEPIEPAPPSAQFRPASLWPPRPPHVHPTRRRSRPTPASPGGPSIAERTIAL